MSIARDLLERFFDCALRKDGAAFAKLFVDGGMLALPFAKLQYVGTHAIAERTQRAWDTSAVAPTRFELTALIECETGLTAEYTVHGTVNATGAPCQTHSIAVLDIGGAQIVAMREYVVAIDAPVEPRPRRPSAVDLAR